MRKNLKYILGLFSGILLWAMQPVWAAGPPAPSPFSNPMIIMLVTLMLLLLIVIGILANILIGAADVKLKRKKAMEKGQSAAALLVIFMLLSSTGVFAQGTTPETTATAAKTIAGMSASTFYIMTGVLFIELMIIIGLLINIKFLLKTEKEKFVTETATPEQIAEIKRNKLSWWDRFNKLKPVSEEADLDLGHDYDGIRELDNRLPPWWLYGFYLTIIFAGIYLWRYHVSHTAPSSKEEYERSVAKAEARIQEYMKKKGDAVDENTVKLLTSADDIAAGKAIFTDPSKCVVCHGPEGGGNAIGPNLTDDYWIYGGNIKDLFKTIKYGAKNGMKSWKDDLSPKQMAQVASYIKTLRGTKPANAREPQGELYKEEAAPSTPAADSTATKNNSVTMK
ncbi:MAG TPA: cbb3-type cytochrome c oxidase N-terminal domain-containing protein [Chitinophagaceae bacterium]|nr:cbb3-type cytochrome c oxidase N-terminal domain-containing protein [Chitinophagaceae bacterium]